MWHIILERPDFMLRWQNIGLDLLVKEVVGGDAAGQGKVFRNECGGLQLLFLCVSKVVVL